jgi:hypothetical protein
MAELSIDYAAHERVRELVDRIRYALESISLRFDEWDQSHVKGPGLYFAVVADREYGTYADPMGANRWPIDQCRTVVDEDAFVGACEMAAFEMDGGVVVAVDGVVESQMVRFRDLGTEPVAGQDADDIEYEEWMGSRHMSAIETSVRPEVVATITLSEETGRVSVFRDGVADTTPRKQLGGRWRTD